MEVRSPAKQYEKKNEEIAINHHEKMPGIVLEC